jgi:hypothetical protein
VGVPGDLEDRVAEGHQAGQGTGRVLDDGPADTAQQEGNAGHGRLLEKITSTALIVGAYLR